jgi:hypothetical protein
MLGDIRHRTQSSLCLDRENRGITAAIITDQGKPARPLDTDIARCAAARRLGVQQPEPAGGRVDGESTHAPALLPSKIIHFIHSVQQGFVGMECQVRGIQNAYGFLLESQPAAREIEPIDMDPLAPAAFMLGVGANEDDRILMDRKQDGEFSSG